MPRLGWRAGRDRAGGLRLARSESGEGWAGTRRTASPGENGDCMGRMSWQRRAPTRVDVALAEGAFQGVHAGDGGAGMPDLRCRHGRGSG